MFITMPEELEPLSILVFFCRKKAWCTKTQKNVEKVEKVISPSSYATLTDAIIRFNWFLLE